MARLGLLLGYCRSAIAFESPLALASTESPNYAMLYRMELVRSLADSARARQDGFRGLLIRNQGRKL